MPGHTITIANNYGTFPGPNSVRNATGRIPPGFRQQILLRQNGYYNNNGTSTGNNLFNRIQSTKKYRMGGFISSRINRISRNGYKRKMRAGGLLKRRKRAVYSRPSYRTGGRVRSMRRR